MSHNFLSNANFHFFLNLIDQDLAHQTRQKGCPECGHKLHQANYPRSPRTFSIHRSRFWLLLRYGIIWRAAPYISLSLINCSGNMAFPSLYVIFVSLIGLVSVIIGRISQTIKYKLIENEN